MHRTFWIQTSMLAVVLGVALAAPAGASMPDACQAPDPTVPPRDARGPPQTEYGARRPESTTRPPGPLRDLAL